MSNIKIIQSSPSHTGSTLLVNLVHGFLLPDKPVMWDTSTKIHKHLITKTHEPFVRPNESLNAMKERYSEYELYFIMSERNDERFTKIISDEYKADPNVLVIDYHKLLKTDNNSWENIIDYHFEQFTNFIPKELHPQKSEAEIKQDMRKRVDLVNKTVLEYKDKPFKEWCKFTNIHGGHRDRKFH